MCLDNIFPVVEIVLIRVMVVSIDFSPSFTHSHAEFAASIWQKTIVTLINR